MYVSILRANGIPARCLTGRSIDPNTTNVTSIRISVSGLPLDIDVMIARIESSRIGFSVSDCTTSDGRTLLPVRSL